MTQDGTDRLVIGLGTAIGFVVGGFFGSSVGERSHLDTELGLGGALLGSVIGALVSTPTGAQRCPRPGEPAIGVGMPVGFP